jgi:hypothetical protein
VGAAAASDAAVDSAAAAVALRVKDPGRSRIASIPLPVPRGEPLLLGPLSLPPPVEAPLRTPARAGAAPLPLLPLPLPPCCAAIAAATTSPNPRPDACRGRAGELPGRPDVTDPVLAALAVLARRLPRAPPPLTLLLLPALSLLASLSTLPRWSLAPTASPPPGLL